VLVFASIGVLPLLGLALAVGVAIAAFLPLRGRSLRRLPLATSGMVVAHFGIAVALFGVACDSAFSEEKLAAIAVGESAAVGPWRIELAHVAPVAGPNWTAIEGSLLASYKGGEPIALAPQSRNFWAPPQETTESALHTRWNGQLYTVIGKQAGEGKWQLRLWWKPFVPFIWLGGMLVALGGLLALVGRVASDLKRRAVKTKVAERRAEAAA
jgi:cytochrome c-type biogenesis protein CcmF